MTTREVSASDIKAVVAKLKSAPVSKRLGERFYISEELFRIAVNSQAKEEKMKKYRLKKDTPTIKAGTIFQEVTSDYDKSRELVRIMPLGGTTSPQWTIDDINNFDEWFEEVREFEEWRPKKADFYKILRWGRGIPNQVVWQDSYEDNFLLSIGNAYPLDTPDDLIIKEQKLIPQAMHRLKIAAKKAWFELDGSEGPDWGDGFQEKWKLSYDHSTDIFLSTGNRIEQFGSLPYFPTEESAQAYIDSNKDDLKLLFGVE